MIGRKKQPMNTDDIKISIPGLTTEAAYAHVYDYIAGRESKDPVYNVSGFRVNVEAIAVRTYKADPYRLKIKLGGHWLDVERLPSEFIQAAVDGGHMVEHGPSPQEVAKQKEQERERQQKLTAELAQQDQARERALSRREGGFLREAGGRNLSAEGIAKLAKKYMIDSPEAIKRLAGLVR